MSDWLRGTYEVIFAITIDRPDHQNKIDIVILNVYTNVSTFIVSIIQIINHVTFHCFE